MASIKYLSIYEYLKSRILLNEFEKYKKLPSENELSSLFNVSRNTVRRSLDMLASEGLISSVHGKGVFVIDKKPFEFLVGGLQSFKEVSIQNNINYKTSIPVFNTVTVDTSLHMKTKFTIGSKLFKILRIRNIDNLNVILDINYFNSDIVKDITKDIAYDSIYYYIENELKLKISGAQKIVSIVPATDIDRKYLDLCEHNLVAVITNFVYLDDGTLFEYTESRHRPDKFIFNTFARR